MASDARRSKALNEYSFSITGRRHCRPIFLNLIFAHFVYVAKPTGPGGVKLAFFSPDVGQCDVAEVQSLDTREITDAQVFGGIADFGSIGTRCHGRETRTFDP